MLRTLMTAALGGLWLAACGTPTTVRPAPEAPPAAPVDAPPAAPVEAPSPPLESSPPAASPPAAEPGPAPTPRAPVEERAPPPATVTPLPPPPAAASILGRLLPPRTRDAAGWSEDIATAFAALRIEASRENVCSVVAITEQESLFVADPRVPGLSKIVWNEIERRRSRFAIPRLIVDKALATRSPDGRSYKARIDALRTEKEMNALYQEMISELPFGRQLLAGSNPVRTGGPMQVSVAFAEAHAARFRYPYPVKSSIRDEVFTRRGGMYFGIAILLDYPAAYDDPVYRFADFNAGRHSSRNAAFQQALAIASGRPLIPDGDLLRYRDGAPSGETSATERALASIAKELRLSRSEIAGDLLQEKRATFATTRLFQQVFALAERKRGRPLPRAAIPRIELKSPKITRKLTTEWFAKRVRWRYDTCLQRAS